ncbi:MAG: class I SAM-dependent methyltransferase [Verrucomicrobiota bacterium JB022]|nr:class I SAM-dependent methyltransferase [Verrucomicrobiota bacterium JB022]
MQLDSSWRYDEFKQIGKDYGDPAEVAVYDSSHADFRDIAAEARKVLDRLGVGASDVLIDFGAGTGIFAREAAKRCARVYAVDVSETMIAHASAQAQAEGLDNLVFAHRGFLTYEHESAPAAAITSTFAFHHLPDFWKGIALQRMFAMLKPGGRLYLHDVVLPSEQPLETIAAFVEAQAAAGGDFLRDDAEGHFREEFSTYDWVMEGLLTRAGFTILEADYDGVMATYLCAKEE